MSEKEEIMWKLTAFIDELLKESDFDTDEKISFHIMCLAQHAQCSRGSAKGTIKGITYLLGKIIENCNLTDDDITELGGIILTEPRKFDA